MMRRREAFRPVDVLTARAAVWGAASHRDLAVLAVGEQDGDKAPGRVIGVHHLLAYLARHPKAITAAEAWTDAIALTMLKPPVTFFGRSASAVPVSDDIKRTMLAYIGGTDHCEF